MMPLHRVDSYDDTDRREHQCALSGACRHPGATRARLPLEPLRVAYRSENVSALAVALRQSLKTVQEWSRRGVPLLQADRAACKLGLHPSSVWAEQWWEVA